MERNALGSVALAVLLSVSVQPAAAGVPSPQQPRLGVSTCAPQFSTFLVRADGQLRVWGGNESGVLGLGSVASNYYLPEAHSFSGQAVAAARYHSLLLQDGNVYSAGFGANGRLGHGNTTNYSMFTQIAALSDVVQVATGNTSSFALKSDGTVWSWGTSEGLGMLGLGNLSSNASVPTQISALSDVSAIAVGCYVAAALKSDGTVWTWGYGGMGALGHGNTSNLHTPTQISGLADVVEIATGGVHVLARRADGSVYSWGDNSYGQLGLSDYAHRYSPVQIPGIPAATALRASTNTSAMVAEDGSVWGWGENFSNALGEPTYTNATIATPTVMSAVTDFVDFAVGRNTRIVRRDGSVWGMGFNAAGELGTNDTTDRYVLTQAGAAAHAAASFTPTSVAFGNVTRGTGSPTASTLLENETGLSMNLAFGSATPAPFLNAIACIDDEYLPAATCTLEFEIDTGAAAGDYSADFALLNQDVLAGVQYVSMSATLEEPALDPDFAFDPAGPLAYGAKGLGQTRDEVISVVNQGGGSLNISKVTLSRGDFKLVSNGCTGASLGAGDSCDMTVRFSPLGPGAKSATLSVTSNDATPVNTYSVTGTGARLQLSPDQRQLRFARTPLTLMPKPTQVLTLSNTGGADLDITNVSLASADFGITADTCDGTTLAPAASCTITVEFHPASTGSKRASLDITTSDPRRPNLSVALIGVGIN